MHELTHSATGSSSHSALTMPMERVAINFAWLHNLRWTAIVGQILTIAIVRVFLDNRFPCIGMIAIITATASTNVALGLWLRYRSRHGWPEWKSFGEWVLRAIMAMDILSLTGLLYLSGGPVNPFTTFYLVNVALAAVLVDSKSAWALCGLALFGYFLLFWRHVPVECLACKGDNEALLAGSINLHLQGMFVAFGAAGGLIVYFISRVNRSLALREADLVRIRERRIQDEKLDALATLAAGAAHELASPLATIAVVARELELELERDGVSGRSVEDMQVIRTEVDRCRRILDQMATSAGQAVGERIVTTTIQTIIECVVNGLPDKGRINVIIDPDILSAACRMLKEAVCQAIRAIVQNALDASPASQRVSLEVRGGAGIVQFTVTDEGPGMDLEVLKRVGEPFFTTKEPGRGMGLGIFLSRRILERLGGRLTLRSSPGQGTTVVVSLPQAVSDSNDAASAALPATF